MLTVTLLEFKEDAEKYNAAEESSNTPVIALSMQAQLKLKEKGIPYHTSIPYFSNEDHAETLKLSEQWLNLFQEEVGLSKPMVTELVFCIRPYISYLLWISRIIDAAVDKWQPQKLSSPAGQTPDNDSNWKMALDDRPLGYLIQQKAQRDGLVYDAFGSPEADAGAGHQDVQKEETETVSPDSGIWSKLAAGLVQRYCKKRKTILIGSEGYGLPQALFLVRHEIPGHGYLSIVPDDVAAPSSVFFGLVRSVFKGILKAESGNHIVRIPLGLFPTVEGAVKGTAKGTEDYSAGHIREKLNRLAERIDTEWQQRFNYRGFELGPIIARKLRTGIADYLVALAGKASRLHALMESAKPSFVVSPYGAGIYTFLGDVAQQEGIPSLIITHGSHIPPKNECEEIEHRRLSENLMLSEAYKYTIAQTPWAWKHAEYYHALERTFKTNPLLFATVDKFKGEDLRKRLGIASDAKVLVYAISQKKRSSLRFHVYETEDEYLSSMSDLVLAVNTVENVHLVLKLHPSTEFTEEEMRRFLPPCECMTVLHREPFLDVLSMSDLLISYCSTAIEDAAINRIPVVLYDKWARYSHVDAYNCDKTEQSQWPGEPIYYTTEAGRLGAVLDHALKKSEQVATDDNLYKPHLFAQEEVESLGNIITRLIAEKKK